LVGERVGPAKSFLVPLEFLRRRSRWFRDLLERQAGELSSKVIRLPETTIQTMEDFFLWTLSLQPQIYERAEFSEVVRLGIFAWRYQISALINQATDMIRNKLAHSHWQLEASIVDDVYEAAPAGSPLREVIRAALGGLPRSSVEGEGRARDEWRATFLKHAQFGWDYVVAGGSGWTSQDYLLGACRFHDHQGVSHGEELLVSENRCPYAQEECFPTLEEESIKSQERDEEQERRRADEEREEEEEEEDESSIEAVVGEAKEPVATKPVVKSVVAGTVVNGVAMEPMVNGVAREPVEPVADDVARDTMINGVVTETAETVVNDMATESVEPAIDDVATEVSLTAEAVEPATDDMMTEASVTTEVAIDDKTEGSVTTEAVTDDMKTEGESVKTEGSVATEVVDTAIDDMKTEVAIDDTKTEASMTEAATDDIKMERNVKTEGSATTEAVEPAIDNMPTEPVEPVVDDAATERVMATEVVNGVEGQVAAEAKKKKKKKKKKAGGIGQLGPEMEGRDVAGGEQGVLQNV
jgi:hypothetical protein